MGISWKKKGAHWIFQCEIIRVSHLHTKYICFFIKSIESHIFALHAGLLANHWILYRNSISIQKGMWSDRAQKFTKGNRFLESTKWYLSSLKSEVLAFWRFTGEFWESGIICLLPLTTGILIGAQPKLHHVKMLFPFFDK